MGPSYSNQKTRCLRYTKWRKLACPGGHVTWHHFDPTSGTDPTLVVGYSGKPSSDGVVLVAADLARRAGASLHVVHAICRDDYPINPEAADWEEQAAARVAEQRRHAEDLLASTSTRWIYEAIRGTPAAVLARISEEQNALLIVLGGPAKGLLHALRLDRASVSRNVIDSQLRPVLVVPLSHDSHAA
jgi:nucleotide-binding universal stress UspA family protein